MTKVHIVLSVVPTKILHTKFWKVQMANSIGRELLNKGLIKFKIIKKGKARVLEAEFKM